MKKNGSATIFVEYHSLGILRWNSVQVHTPDIDTLSLYRLKRNAWFDAAAAAVCIPRNS